jgi:four helix bundle protein
MRVYHKAIEVVALLRGVSGAISRHDRELVSQLKRAASSVPLNIAEGLGHRGGNRELRFQTELGSAREVQACLEVARAWGYLGSESDVVLGEVIHLNCMLHRLIRSRG